MVPVLDASATQVAVPSGEPAIVATVRGAAITVQQLESFAPRVELSHERVLAVPQGADLPASVKAVLTESPEQVRQQALASLKER